MPAIPDTISDIRCRRAKEIPGNIYNHLLVKLVPSPEADDVTVTSSQSLMPPRDR